MGEDINKVDYDQVAGDIRKIMDIFEGEVSEETVRHIAESVIESHTHVTVEQIKGHNAVAEEISRRNTKQAEFDNLKDLKQMEIDTELDRARTQAQGEMITEVIKTAGNVLGTCIGMVAGRKLFAAKMLAQGQMLDWVGRNIVHKEESGEWMSESKTGSSIINGTVSSLTRHIMED